MESNVLDDFLNFESKHELFDIRIQKVPFWHISRKMIYEEIKKKNTRNSIGVAQGNLNDIPPFKKLKLKVNQIPAALFKNPLFGNKKKDILVFNHSRRIKTGKNYDCAYTDEILKKIEYDYKVVEQPYLSAHKRPVRTKDLKYTDAINFLTNKNKKNIYNKISRIEEDKEVINCLLIKVEKEFSVSLNKKEILKKIVLNISEYLAMYPYIEEIIKQTQPKIILEVVSYEISRYIINSVANDNKIPTVELQHGSMGKYHIAYNFKEKQKLSNFPDYIFTFGQFWKDNTRLPIPESKVKVVGWPYYEKKVKESKRFSEMSVSGIKKSTILFISQGTIGKELSRFAVKLKRMLDEKQYQIVYKLHPGEFNRWKNEYPWLLDSDIQVIDDIEKDMHYFFSKTDVQVGVYSTALFEGLGYGLPTYIIKLPGHEYMEELYNKELIYLVDEENQLKKHLVSNNFEKKMVDINYLWKNNSIDNMVQEIKNIINQDMNKNE